MFRSHAAGRSFSGRPPQRLNLSPEPQLQGALRADTATGGATLGKLSHSVARPAGHRPWSRPPVRQPQLPQPLWRLGWPSVKLRPRVARSTGPGVDGGAVDGSRARGGAELVFVSQQYFARRLAVDIRPPWRDGGMFPGDCFCLRTPCQHAVHQQSSGEIALLVKEVERRGMTSNYFKL